MIDERTKQWVEKCLKAGLDVVGSEYFSTKYGHTQCIRVEVKTTSEADEERLAMFRKDFDSLRYMMMVDPLREDKYYLYWVPYSLFDQAIESADSLSFQLEDTDAYLQEDPLCVGVVKNMSSLFTKITDVHKVKQEERNFENFRKIQSMFKTIYLLLEDESWYKDFCKDMSTAKDDFENVKQLMEFTEAPEVL